MTNESAAPDDLGSLSCFTGVERPSDLFYDCIMADMTGAVGGEAMFGLLAGGLIMLVLYLAGDGDMAVPTVTTILLGSVMVPALPPQYTQMAYAIVVVGIAAAIIGLAGRYVLE